MTEAQPQLYVNIPSRLASPDLPRTVSSLCDTIEISAMRLRLDGMDFEDRLRFCDQIRTITEPRDIALVVTDDPALFERAALDGVHLTENHALIAKLRETQGDAPIIGAYCCNSRHDGMVAGENGADYITFGPVDGSELSADDDLFAWWSEQIEIPVVAEGGLDEARIKALSDKVDFFSLGDEIWNSDDPIARASQLAAARGGSS